MQSIILKYKSANTLLFLSVLLFLLLLTSVFKNISYPLFWADESSTAIGAERVIEYGYPKAHDGKNVFIDFGYPNPSIAVNEKDDAFIAIPGGSYYFGAIGYKLASFTNDIHLKTGIFRSTFAVAGILGLMIIVFFISKFFSDKFSKYAFVLLFLFLELMSVSLALLLREVRYYSLVIFLSCLIIGIYSVYRFYKPFSKLLFIFSLSISLWMLFMTFPPVYFIVSITIAITELVIFVSGFKHGFISSVKKVLPVVLSLVVSFIAVYPFLLYYKTFELSGVISTYMGYNSGMYFDNLYTMIRYFRNFELLFLAIALKLFLIFYAKGIYAKNKPLFNVSAFLTIYFIVSIFIIPRIPQFIFTRYIIYLQPVLSIIILLDFFMLLQHVTSGKKIVNLKTVFLITVFFGMIIYNLVNNSKYITGHLYELTNEYKGPLDFTIPYIQNNYSRTDTLVIAANYEEYSYMYYLKSKVIVGSAGNNLEQDSKLIPHIIAYRKGWGNYKKTFGTYFNSANYESIGFPVFDNYFNNIPELNFMPQFNHQFKTLLPNDMMNAAHLFIRKQ